MTCRPFKFGDGGYGIMCSRPRRDNQCYFPGCFQRHVALCDYPVGEDKTCDLKLCPNHRRHQGDALSNIDYCVGHDVEARKAAAS